ncbi:MAG: pyridoxine 5'-phosphate synthase, partial [Candidatus Wallbacteria bacterium GWC2_49_35]
MKLKSNDKSATAAVGRHIRLGVNIDHVATLRNARGGAEPDPLQAAFICRDAGCDQITIHLREDRRHITDRDLGILSCAGSFPVNLEMAAVDEIVDIAAENGPYMATLVPERRAERTTEGGLDAAGSLKTLTKQIKKLKDAGILVSLFIEAEKKQIEASIAAGADAIEIHTGRFADCFS